MSKRRERKPFATVSMPELPAWGRPTWGSRKAHLFRIVGPPSLRRPHVISVCGASNIYNLLLLDAPHPDDRRCKRCLAWEAKRAKEDA